MLHHFQHIPAIAEHFAWDTFRFEIVDMDRNRIDKILVSVANKSEADKDEGRPSS